MARPVAATWEALAALAEAPEWMTLVTLAALAKTSGIGGGKGHLWGHRQRWQHQKNPAA